VALSVVTQFVRQEGYIDICRSTVFTVIVWRQEQIFAAFTFVSTFRTNINHGYMPS